MRPATPLAGGAMLALALAGYANAAEPSTSGQHQNFWVSAKMIKQRDADRALRETLNFAAEVATTKLSASGAFSHNPARHVGLPDPLTSMRGDWNAVGRSGALDTLEIAMNHAAESAARMTRPDLQRAIADMDFSDAVAIVRSGDEAAAQFFALRSRAELAMQIRPLIETSLSQSGAFTALDQAAIAGKAPQRAAEYRGAVIEATLNKELDAIFTEMRAEERAIRANPAARRSPLLNEVFSALIGGSSTQANAGR